MKLSAPTQPVWLIAVIAGGLGFVSHWIQIPVVSPNQFWFLSIGFFLLLLGTVLNKF